MKSKFVLAFIVFVGFIYFYISKFQKEIEQKYLLGYQGLQDGQENQNTKQSKNKNQNDKTDKRQQIRQQNQDDIDKINQQNQDFKLKSNNYVDFTDSEFDQLIRGVNYQINSSFIDNIPFLGGQNIHHIQYDEKSNKLLQSDEKKNQPIDYRIYDLEVKNQEFCNTGWAYAINTLLEVNFSDRALSEQYLIECFEEKEITDVCDQKIDRLGLKPLSQIRKIGIKYQDQQPYKLTKNEKNQCQKEESNFQIPKDSLFLSFDDKSNPQCERLKSMINQFGPVYTYVISNTPYFKFYDQGIASHNLNEPWLFDQSGCFLDSCLYQTQIVDHAVVIMGYTDEYWIVKNSFGKDWGENGYIRIKMGNYFNICHKGFAIISQHKKFN